MSALLNMNAIPLISWKGLTFSQIHSSIQKNGQIDSNISNVRNLFSARPLKIYRREIASTTSPVCHSKYSLKIDIFNRPNGTINNTAASNVNDLANIMDITLPNNTCEQYTNCSVVLSPAENAKNRVRSSGMNKRKFNEGRNNDTYYTSSSQYLSSRNRTFAQNQYNYIRQGDSTAKPGTSLSSANVYTPSGINHCAKYYIAQNTSFSYVWINKLEGEARELVDDTTEYAVNIPAGYYSLDDINRLFKQAMFANLHYFIKDSATNTNEYYSDNISFALNIAFNNNTQTIELQSYLIDNSKFPTENYTVPTMPNGLTSWSVPDNGNGLYPQFVVNNNIFKNAIGFNEGSYPESKATDVDVYKISNSSFSSGLKPMYVKLYYKPNNPQFAQQGGVNSSDLITRKKYNSITNSTSAYRTAFGGAVANALAYGVPSNGYTVKDKLGYPLKKTPTFSKYTDEMKQCSVTKIANTI